MLWAKDWGRAALTLVVATLLLERFQGLGVSQQTKGQNHLEVHLQVLQLMPGVCWDCRRSCGLGHLHKPLANKGLYSQMCGFSSSHV